MNFFNLPNCIKRKKPRNNLGEDKIKTARKLMKVGNSYMVAIPPILIEKLKLLDIINGVILEEQENSIIIYKNKKGS